MDDWQEPPPEAYGTVTDPERYRPLHAAASRLLDALAATYDVRRRDHRAPDPGPAGRAVPAVALVPVVPAAGPLRVVFSDFPGLRVTLGRWRDLSLPSCGCDACDEQPADLVEELGTEVATLVDGTFSERLTHGRAARQSWGRTHLPESAWGWTALSRAEATRLGPAARIDWAPWPRRA
ncbi:hypothetical protein GCM10010124_33790 [Pilimelia terevasa]|uniref:Uncharacterized protein n=1 Tax=Pilimelia terevasa TaxID=53372 RepID=A0A8J3BR39_9ACTN|nr:DUF6226 family protein [Pilimelia terevasa]GGK38208.1 hypothetical protein GCM10010124_33790 [Pilimelia terevasa]